MKTTAFSHRFLAVALLLFAGVLVPVTVRAQETMIEKRVALVIGNDRYQHARVLNNAVNDATAVATLLRDRLGFTLVARPDGKAVWSDVTVDGFYDALERFKKASAGARVGLIYYAGHGVEVNQANYLLPVDAVLERESQLRSQAVKVGAILDDLKNTRLPAKLLILDCCRDNPLSRSWVGTRSAAAGLAEMSDGDLPDATMIMYASAPGKVALDGAGGNSPFTAALVETFARPGVSVFDAFLGVSDAVAQATGERQVPWIKFDGAGRAFRLFSLGRGPVAPSVSPTPVTPMPAVGGDAVEGKRAGEVRSFGGIELVWCPAGEFEMGSPVAEEGRFDDERQHRVKLTRGFWLGKTEVTQGQWAAVMGTSVGEQRDKADKSWDLRGEGPHYPMYYVSWEEAEAFCEKLNREAGVGAGWKWTLPSEAQWEYGCRAGTSGPYGGRELGELGWYDENAGGTTHEVGRKGANGWGLQDMHGNVLEWCLDRHGDYETGSVSDPVGADGDSGRVSRGGGWYNLARYCRSAYRSGASPSFRDFILGFRVALSSTR